MTKKRSKMILNWIKVGRENGNKFLWLARSKATGRTLAFYDRVPSGFYDPIEKIDLTADQEPAR